MSDNENSTEDDKQNLIGVDPLAWLSDEEKQTVLNENKASEVEAGQESNSESAYTISLPSALTIRDVSELMEELNEIDDKHQELVFDAENIERVDTAAMQLILGFYLFAKDSGRKVIWNKPSETLHHAAEILGLKELININPEAV